MLCFVSDLHLATGNGPGSVSDEQLEVFVGQVVRMSEQAGEAVRLVFLGDILELLRSPKWSAIWEKFASAPWTAAGPSFRNFQGGHSERCAIEIAAEIRNLYPRFEARLRSAVADGRIATTYVFGNHDYMVQLSQRLREMLVNFLSLSHDPHLPFHSCYTDRASSVFATHGHQADPVNWHRPEDGWWAMGDAVVLRVVNRFAERACEVLGLTPATRLGRLVQDIENVEPTLDVPLYVRWLAETALASAHERAKFLDTWRHVVDGFLGMSDFQGDGYSGAAFSSLRTALEWSKQFDLAAFARKLATVAGPSGPDYHRAALNLGRQQNCRYVVFGHTHEPAFAPIGGSPDLPFFYVNTGCWRRVVSRPRDSPDGPFVPRRANCRFLVDPEGSRGERYQLHQAWQAT